MYIARRIVTPILALAVVLHTAASAKAQSVYGQVSGRFVSATNAPVAGASISLTSTATGARIQTTSDAAGYITIANLAADLYEIEVRAEGYKTVRGSVAVNADSTSTVNAILTAGDPNTVAQKSEAGASVLKLDRTDVSTLFDARSIDDLPLRDRNVTTLQLLVPGAALGELFTSFKQNPQNSEPVNVSGQYFSGSAFQLDGAENREPLEGLVVINPTLDSAKEMKVTTQGYNAEFGQATAGVVTVQTKSGTNAWHGDAFGFRRTGWGQSVDPFATGGVPPSKNNIFGGSFGGPIVKNKLFFFGDYQGTRSSQGANLLLSVPPQSVRQTCVGNVQGAPALCDLSAYGPFISGPLVDPYNLDSKTGGPNPFTCVENGQVVPCNQIPNTPTNGVSSVTSQAVAVLQLVPAPNYTPTDANCAPMSGLDAVCNNYLASGQELISGDQFDVRIDFNATSRLRLFGRYSLGDFSDTGTPAFGTAAGGPGTNPSGFAGIADTRNQGLSAGFTYSLNSKLLTDFRFGYLRYRLNIIAQDNGQTPNLGIPGITAADTGDPFATGLPDFEIPGQDTTAQSLSGSGDYLRLGYSGIANSCSCPLREREQQFQFVNNWTRSAGRHVVKWGADLRFLQNFRFSSDRPPTGYFDFAPDTTGLGLATFLIGDVSGGFDRTLSSAAAVKAGERQMRFGFYGQDTWRVSARLTLNYGLRWDIYFPQTATGAGSFLIPNLTNPDPAATYFSGPPAGGIAVNLTSFAPRLGFAYLINPTTVIRAGYGRSFDSGYAGDVFGIAGTGNPPVTTDQTVGGFNLSNGPPLFTFPTNSSFSLLELAAENAGNPTLNPPIPPSGASIYAVPSRVRVPTVDSWNLTLQHEFSAQLYFELAYVGNKGTHGFTDSNIGTYYNLNQPSLQDLIAVAQNVHGKYINCKSRAIFGNYCLTKPALRTFYQEQGGETGFDPTLFPVNYFGNDANDNYNSLQAKVHKSFNRGYSILAHYTWSKGFDYEPNYFASNPGAGYGPDSFDIRHRFVMTNIWDLPLGRGKSWLGGIGQMADRFLGGWTISAITIWQSGLPFTPSYNPGACAADTDTGNRCRPNRVGTVHISGGREQYFTTTGGQALPGTDCVDPSPAFPTGRYCGVGPDGQPVPGPVIGPWQRPGAGQIGNVGRDSFTGPGFFQSDIGLAKVISISERTALRFRADAINAFNKVNLGQPNPCVDCRGGGSITSVAVGAVPREFQFSLRIEF
jgi:Carboxypeptidase regulatory-like domain/TonB dependent receptor